MLTSSSFGAQGGSVLDFFGNFGIVGSKDFKGVPGCGIGFLELGFLTIPDDSWIPGRGFFNSRFLGFLQLNSIFDLSGSLTRLQLAPSTLNM